MRDYGKSNEGITRRRFLKTATGLAVATTSLGLGAGAASAVNINPRSAWAIDRPPKGPLSAEDVKFLIVHHSASRNGHTSADAPAILRSFYDYHTGEKGWPDIAYNFLIDAEGGIWEGRSGSLDGPVSGDATGGNQGFTQLVCIIGDYNAVNPSRASLASLVSVLAWLADRYGVATSPGSSVTFTSRGSNKWPPGTEVTTKTITGHRTMSNTTCPGSHLNSYVVGDLMADVTSVRNGEPITTTTSLATSTSQTTVPTTSTSAPSTTSSTGAPTTTITTTPATSVPATSLPAAGTGQPQPSTRPQAPVASELPETPTTTLPLAASEPDSRPSVFPLAVSAAVVAAAGGIAWRFRRMSKG